MFPENWLAPVVAKLPPAVTPPCHEEPLYIFSSSEEVSKYKSPAASALPAPSVVGAEDAI